jgi:hypothetical protein
MTEDRIDPSGSTEQWQAFAQGSDPAEPKKRPTATIVVGVLVVVLILAALALLIFM